MTTEGQQAVNEEHPGRGRLRPKARLLRTLGSDLISGDKVAIIELVKNSYDADASVVVIRFRGPLEKGKGCVEVWDDGHGMDVATLQRSWLDIATDTKLRRHYSPGGRRVLGEKGIGRLAAARLGDEMTLVTRKADSDEVTLLIDWRDFDREDAYLDDVEVGWQVGDPLDFADPGGATQVFSKATLDTWNHGRGTLVKIDRLSRAWTRDDLEELRTALTRLIRPRPLGDPGRDTWPAFQVLLDLVDVKPGLDDLVGSIEPSSDLQTAHYRLTGSVDADGTATFRYTQQHPSHEEEVYGKRLWNKDREKRSPQAGPFDFEINVWDRDSAALRRTLQGAGPQSVAPSAKDLKGFRETLDEVSGVSIYRDGFRVLPFGERGDDWLGLDLRRVQSPTRRVSNNQVIGHVLIGADTNDGLKDQTNREGLLASTDYSDLQRLVVAVISEIETRRYAARRREDPPDTDRGGLFERFDLGEIRSSLEQNHPEDKHLIGLVREKDRDIRAGVKEVQKVLSRFSRLATLGTLIDRVLHDGRTVVALIKSKARSTARSLEREDLTDSEKIAVATQAATYTTDKADLLSLLFNQIAPFGGRRRGRPPEVLTSDVIDKAIALVQQEAEEQHVQLVRAGEAVIVKIDESEMLVVLLNLIRNAVYWVSTGPEGSQRKVIVSSRLNGDGSLTLVVSDSGPGVEESARAYIFDPYYSTKPDGVGLGLSIAGNIVENIYDGELMLVDVGPLDGATFEATFRRRVQ